MSDIISLEEISGIVEEVSRPLSSYIGRDGKKYFKRRGGDVTTKITIVNPNERGEKIITTSFPCHVEKKDIVMAVCTKNKDGLLETVKPVLVLIPTKKDVVIYNFVTAMKKFNKSGFSTAHSIYDSFTKSAEGDLGKKPNEEEICKHIDQLADDIKFHRKVAYIRELFDNSPYLRDIMTILSWWYKNVNIRRVECLCIDIKTLRDSKFSPCQFYDKCMLNPFSIYSISMETAKWLCEHLNIIYSKIREEYGKVVRFLYQKIERDAHSGVSSRRMDYNFSDLKDYPELLEIEYDIVIDWDTYYLRYVYDAETYIADYIHNLLENNYTEAKPLQLEEAEEEEDYIISDKVLNMNLDTVSVIEEEEVQKIEHKHRAIETTLDTLTSDQLEAIEGALTNPVSIITGGGGSGKCLGAGEQVIMFDGRLKKVDELKVKDCLMGYDGKSRQIIGLYTGKDTLWKIIPVDESPDATFVCNTPHLLTLIGEKPKIIESEDNTCIVIFTYRGYEKRISFHSRSYALNFINDVLPKEDIFEETVQKYLERSEEDRRHTYLLKTSVERYYNESTDTYMSIFDRLKFISRYFEHSKGCDILSSFVPYEVKHTIEEEDKVTLYFTFEDASLYKEERARNIVGFLRSLAFTVKAYIDDVPLPHTREGSINNDWKHLKIVLSGKYMCIVRIIRYFTCLDLKVVRSQCKFKIEKYSDEGNYFGFELSLKGGEEEEVSPHVGRFLLSSYIVTHNTTVIKQIVHNLKLRGEPFALTSFTGKAVSRMREVIGDDASTMHYTISLARKTEIEYFSCLIIDECSTVSIDLVAKYLRCLNHKITKLILIGDCNQLEPIEWGNFFAELINSNVIPTYRLTHNHRFKGAGLAPGEVDGILENCKNILTHNVNMQYEFISSSNFMVIDGKIEIVKEIMKQLYDSGVPITSIKIITPLNADIPYINAFSQTIYTANNEYVFDSRGKKWSVGDIVMVKENDYDIKVFNGEEGVIKGFSEDETKVYIHFPCKGTLLTYKFNVDNNDNNNKLGDVELMMEGMDEAEQQKKKLNGTVIQLEHSYAITTHKSQGDEWDYVIFYVPDFLPKGTFFNKNLVYVALSRAKRCCWCIGNKSNLIKGISQAPGYRHNNLGRRIQKLKRKISSTVTFCDDGDDEEDGYVDE